MVRGTLGDVADHDERDAAEALAQVSVALAESLDPADVVSRVAVGVLAEVLRSASTATRRS
jgi:hypothetical protein